MKQAREAKGLIGEQLGGAVGVSKSTISHWESERYQPNLEQLDALCQHLGQSADWFLGRDARQLSADAIQEALAYERLSQEDRRKWRAMRLMMFSPAASA